MPDLRITDGRTDGRYPLLGLRRAAGRAGSDDHGHRLQTQPSPPQHLYTIFTRLWAGLALADGILSDHFIASWDLG